MEKEIIKLPISEIKNNFLSYNLNFLSDGTVICEKIHTNIFLYFTLFLIIGLPLTILSPYKTFNFFYKKTGLDFFSPLVYNINEKKLRRISYIMISIILILLSPYLIFFSLSFFDDEMKYDWDGLYKKIKNDGYDPKNNSYIQVTKFKDTYICTNGNHRHKILENVYPKDMIIDVMYEGESFEWLI